MGNAPGLLLHPEVTRYELFSPPSLRKAGSSVGVEDARGIQRSSTSIISCGRWLPHSAGADVARRPLSEGIAFPPLCPGAATTPQYCKVSCQGVNTDQSCTGGGEEDRKTHLGPLISTGGYGGTLSEDDDCGPVCQVTGGSSCESEMKNDQIILISTVEGTSRFSSTSKQLSLQVRGLKSAQIDSSSALDFWGGNSMGEESQEEMENFRPLAVVSPDAEDQWSDDLIKQIVLMV